MKRWTSDDEFAWLMAKMPDWHKRRQNKAVGDWLTTTTNEFICAFPPWKLVEYKSVWLVSQFMFAAYYFTNNWCAEGQMVVLLLQ